MAKAEVATKGSFSTALSTHLDGIGAALPVGFNKARFVTNAIALLNDNPDLQKYGQAQLLSGLARGAVLGLDFFSKEAYLVPYGNKLNYQTSYTGSVKLAKKYSIRPIKSITAEIVREGDVFERSVVNGEETVMFKPQSFGNGAIVGAFAICKFVDGGIQCEEMRLDELENTRKHSKAKNSMAWADFTEEMYKKTVLRRLCKHIEIDFENTDQRNIFDDEVAIETDPKEIAAAEIAENANKEEFIDIPADEVSVEQGDIGTIVVDSDGHPVDENGEQIFA